MIGDTEKGQTEDIGGIIKVTGLTSNTIYKNVRMRIYDKAGNYQDTFPIAVITRMPNGPKIMILNNNSWSTTKTAQITGKEGFVIKYTLDGTDPSISNGIELTGTGVKSIIIDKENCRVKAIYLNNETEMATDIGISDEAKVDKTGPSISLSVSSYSTYISASWSATDSKSGLNSTAYRYKYGSESWSSWTSSTVVQPTIGDTAISSTFYLEVRDTVGNIASSSKNYSTSGKPKPIDNTENTKIGEEIGTWTPKASNSSRSYNKYYCNSQNTLSCFMSFDQVNGYGKYVCWIMGISDKESPKWFQAKCNSSWVESSRTSIPNSSGNSLTYTYEGKIYYIATSNKSPQYSMDCKPDPKGQTGLYSTSKKQTWDTYYNYLCKNYVRFKNRSNLMD